MKNIKTNRLTHVALIFVCLPTELRQEPGQDKYVGAQMANNLEKKSLKFRCLIYDITQHIAFKRASAILVVANCTLLFFPVCKFSVYSNTYRVQVRFIIFSIHYAVQGSIHRSNHDMQLDLLYPSISKLLQISNNSHC